MYRIQKILNELSSFRNVIASETNLLRIIEHTTAFEILIVEAKELFKIIARQ